MNEETMDRIKKMTSKEVNEFVKSLPMIPYFRLAYSNDRIKCLVDFANLINRHRDEFEHQSNKNFAGEGSPYSPTTILNEYICLEADCFYQYARKCLEEGDKNMPDLPNYYEYLHALRDKILAHRDIDGDLNKTSSWMNMLEKLDEQVTMDNLVSEVDEYFKEVMCRYNSKS